MTQKKTEARIQRQKYDVHGRRTAGWAHLTGAYRTGVRQTDDRQTDRYMYSAMHDAAS